MKPPYRPGIIAHMEAGDVLETRFVLQSKVGSGGMGTLWKALDQKTDKPVALKVLRDPDDGDTARFLHEARILSTLEHPHIVQYFGHGARTWHRPPRHQTEQSFLDRRRCSRG